ncbi:MAG: hypothetical protein AB7E80_14415 [Hyphomicrobiaceae bacterium]
MLPFSLWSHRPVRVRERGRLIAAGYQWQQLRLVEYAAYGAPALAVAALGFVYCLWHRTPEAVAVFLASAGMLAFLVLLARWPHLVLFTSDGRVRTPHGIARRFWVRDLGPIAEVASIEMTTACREYGVVMLTTEGHTYLIAERMRRVDARLVAVQLTKALHEMRTGMASVGAHSTRHAPVGSEVWVH